MAAKTLEEKIWVLIITTKLQQMAEVGKYNKLEVLRKVEHGIYLAGESSNDILLPTAYIPENCEVGDVIEVFVYRDSEDRIIATTLKPKAIVGEFAFLKVVATTNVGAFLDWGLQKDLLAPFKEQVDKMVNGRSYVVYIFLDDETDRVVATSKVNRFLDDERPDLTDGQEVDLLIYRQTDMGFKAIVNNRYMGMIFENEIFQSIRTGQKIKGYVKQIREDGKIDLILQKTGFSNVDPIIKKIFDHLSSNNGSMEITDKSQAEVIYATFGVSKRAFKQALGKMYKERVIIIEANNVRLV